jgi:hypothetical protein
MKIISLLSFPIAQSLKELNHFTLSPSDGESDALLALLSSSNLLLSLQGVQKPCEDPSPWTLIQIQNSKSSSRALWHLLNSLLEECLKSSVILTSVELTKKFFLNTLFLCAMPSWQSLTKLLRDSVSLLCLPLHSLASKVFNNLEVFL